MARIRKQRADLRRLHDLAGIHDADAVADVGRDGEVMGDEQDRHAEFVLKVAEEVEDFLLHGDVEGGRRLVGDEERGIATQGAGNGYALTVGLLAVFSLTPKRIGVDVMKIRNASSDNSAAIFL